MEEFDNKCVGCENCSYVKEGQRFICACCGIISELELFAEKEKQYNKRLELNFKENMKEKNKKTNEMIKDSLNMSLIKFLEKYIDEYDNGLICETEKIKLVKDDKKIRLFKKY